MRPSSASSGEGETGRGTGCRHPQSLLGPELARGPQRGHDYFGRLSGASAGVTRSGRVWQIPKDKLVILKMGHYREKPCSVPDGACSAYPVSVHLGVAKGTVRGSLSYGASRQKEDAGWSSCRGPSELTGDVGVTFRGGRHRCFPVALTWDPVTWDRSATLQDTQHPRGHWKAGRGDKRLCFFKKFMRRERGTNSHSSGTFRPRFKNKL